MAAQTPSTDDPLRLAQAAVREMYLADQASQALGIEIIDVAPGRVRLAMVVRPDMVNGLGICHGGIIFALADSAFAFACNSYGEPMVAAGAVIDFLAPTPRGQRVFATATELTRGARHGIYDVAVTDAAGQVLAQFRGRCSRPRAPRLAENPKDPNP